VLDHDGMDREVRDVQPRPRLRHRSFEHVQDLRPGYGPQPPLYAWLQWLAFQAFGLKQETGWFRLSAGAVSLQDIEAGLARVRAALEALG